MEGLVAQGPITKYSLQSAAGTQSPVPEVLKNYMDVSVLGCAHWVRAPRALQRVHLFRGGAPGSPRPSLCSWPCCCWPCTSGRVPLPVLSAGCQLRDALSSQP